MARYLKAKSYRDKAAFYRYMLIVLQTVLFFRYSLFFAAIPKNCLFSNSLT